MNDTVKTVIKVASAAVFLVLCAAAPFWFAPPGTGGRGPDESPALEWSPPPEMQAATDFNERAAIYKANSVELLYTPQNFEAISFDSEDAEINACLKRRDFLLPELTVDAGEEWNVESEGLNYYYLVSESGKYIRVMVYFRGWDADWHNWIYMVMDIDTQDIYEIYISSDNRHSSDKFGYYIDGVSLPDEIFLASAAERCTGYVWKDFYYIGQTGDDNERELFELTLASQGAAFVYDVHGYTTINPDIGYIIFDWKIICKSATTSMQVFEKNDAIAR